MLKLTCVLMLLLVPALIAFADIKPENFMGVWLFDEEDKDFAEDSSGNEHHATIVGVDRTEGKFGDGLLFEGAGDVNILSTEKLNLGDEFTMMGYFYAEALTGHHMVIAKNNEYLLRIDTPGEGTKMSAFVNINGGWEPRASAFVPDTETWYHYAAVYNSDTQLLIVYVDGVKAGQSARAGDPNPNNENVTIGRWGGGSRFDGIIDDVAILNVALEEDDIKDIAENGLKIVLGGGQNVEPSAKLATSWGSIKNR